MKLARIAFAASLAVIGCSKSEAPPSGPPQGDHPAAPAAAAAKDPAAAKKLIAGGAVVVDVRTPEEYGDGHLPQATNIPVQDFGTRIAEVDKLVGGDKSKPVVVYCAAGKRAAKAKAQLEAAGYTQVVNGGGYDDLR